MDILGVIVSIINCCFDPNDPMSIITTRKYHSRKEPDVLQISESNIQFFVFLLDSNYVPLVFHLSDDLLHIDD